MSLEATAQREMSALWAGEKGSFCFVSKLWLLLY